MIFLYKLGMDRAFTPTPGAFSPPTLAHAHIMGVCMAGADCVWVDPDPPTQWKRGWLGPTHEARLLAEGRRPWSVMHPQPFLIFVKIPTGAESDSTE